MDDGRMTEIRPSDPSEQRNAITLHIDGTDIFGDLRVTGFASKYMQRKVAPDLAEGVRKALALDDVKVTVYFDGAECAQCAKANRDLDEVLNLERMFKGSPDA